MGHINRTKKRPVKVIKFNIECPYDECKLSKNNFGYAAQGFFYFVSFFILIISFESFTPFNIALFTAPILCDLLFVDIDVKLFKAIRVVYVIIDLVIVAICLLTGAGFFVSSVQTIAVTSSALAFNEFQFPRWILITGIGLNMLVPLFLYMGVPSQRTRNIALQHQFLSKEA